MQIGASTASWTVRSIACSSSGSSTRGIPALTSSMSAPAATWVWASFVTVERSPPRNSSAKTLRPVGLIRSPMMQNGCAAPMVTVLDRDRSTVSIGFPFVRCPPTRDAQARAQLGDTSVLPEGDEVKTGHAGLGHRVGGELVGELEALVFGVGRALDAPHRLWRDVDARHPVGHEAHAPDRAQDADRRDDGQALGQPDVAGGSHEALELL